MKQLMPVSDVGADLPARGESVAPVVAVALFSSLPEALMARAARPARGYTISANCPVCPSVGICHGGQIQVESKPNKGAECYFSIPSTIFVQKKAS